MSSKRRSSAQERDRQPGSTLRVDRPIFSFRHKAIIKHLRSARLFSKPKEQHSAYSIAKRKRSKYAHVRPPPPLANELALMQFTGGGNIETHIKRVMKEQAKATGGSRNLVVGVADVYRTTNGGIWWDADEEVEYAHLLEGVDKVRAEADAEVAFWEHFETVPVSAERIPLTSLDWDGDHRPSSDSGSSEDFYLKYLVPPQVYSYPTLCGMVGRESIDALSLPSRPLRQSLHVIPAVSLVDLQAFGKPEPRYHSPPSAQVSISDRAAGTDARPRPFTESKGARRCRILPSLDGLSRRNIPAPPATISTLHIEIDATRSQFIRDSFAPPESMTSSTLPTRESDTVCSSNTSESSGTKSPKVVKLSSSIFRIRRLFGKLSR